MQKRKFDELISRFNRKVSDMSIDQKYKMELLGMISAIGFAHEEELGTNLAEVGTDCISRRSVIDAVRAALLSWSFMPEWRDNKIIEAVEQLPPIQPEPHWIPVEQALPNKEGKYLCTRTGTWCVDGKAKKVTDVAILDYSDNIYDIWKGYGEIFQNGFAFGKMWQGKLDNLQKVSAWMPLPKHYKGGG